MSRKRDFRQLLSLLADPDPRVRAEVIGKINDFRPENRKAVPALILCLQDPDGWVRASAAHALGQIESAASSAVPALLKALKDPDCTVREWSAGALVFIGAQTEEAVSALMEATQDRSIRSEAFHALGSTGSAGATAVPFLIRALGDMATSSMAAEALSRLGPVAHPAIPALIEALKIREFYTRQYVAEALGSIGLSARTSVPALLDALYDREFYACALKESAGWAQGRPKELDTLAPMHPGRVVMAIATALWRIAGHQAAIIALVEQLQATTGDVRRLAAQRLGWIGPPARTVVADLVRSSKDEAPCVRGAVLRALARITTAASAVTAMTCALNDNVEGVRVDAALALSVLGPHAVDASDSLRERMADASAMVRVTSAWALWRIYRQPQYIEVLIDALRDPCSDVRFAAIRTLRVMGVAAKPAAGAIEASMGDDDEFVREDAKRVVQLLESNSGRWN